MDVRQRFSHVECLALECLPPTLTLHPPPRKQLQEASKYMQEEHSVDLAETLGSCIANHDKLIVYRGGPLTWCPAAAAPAGAPEADD